MANRLDIPDHHDVKTAADENLLSHPYTEIARAAKEEQRMIMTLDIEFTTCASIRPVLIPASFCSACFLSPLPVNAFIIDFVRRTDLNKLSACIAVGDPIHVRVRFPKINSE